MLDATVKPAVTLHDLEKPEHLLVWTFRAIASGQADCPLLARTYAAACGASGDHALGVYFVFVRSVSQWARRRLKAHAPGCPCVCPDELALVGVVAAAQASLQSKDETLLRMRLNYLMSGAPLEKVVFAAQEIAQILLVNGHALPLRASGPPAGEIFPANIQVQ